jgi:2-polyprenyl-6-methoxyphenol hydroxylase-like FAD-dependent oxidoreductase
VATEADFDVTIVGGSVAGCAAALLFARAGHRVAVLERSSAPDAYKQVCTHFIQPGTRPTLERLGLVAALEQAGAVPNQLELHTRRGWIRARDTPTGWNIRRQTLDPLLRRTVQATPGVTWFGGHIVDALLRRRGRVSGVHATDANGRSVALEARLVVGADGRHSSIAKLAQLRTRTRPNRRFVYYTYYDRLALAHGANSQYWHLDPEPNLAFAFANDGATTLLGVFLPQARLPEWKGAVERRFEEFWDGVPDAPDVRTATRVSEFRGMLELPNQARPPATRGLALLGDAALCLDSIWGTGCGFALRSADWLAECVSGALAGSNTELDRALRRYARRHAFETRARALHITDFSTARRNRWFEELLFTGALNDAEVAKALLSYLGCVSGATSLLAPPIALRMLRESARQRRFDRMLPARSTGAGP